MVIVGGVFEVDPAQRDRFLAGRIEGMRRSRGEPGCIEYTFSADPLDPGRVVLFERWESQDHLDAHLAAMASAPPPSGDQVAPTSVSIVIYDVAGSRPLEV